MDAFTTSISPACKANRLMMSSVALPKVALRRPPTPEDVCPANSSVASPDEFRERDDGRCGKEEGGQGRPLQVLGDQRERYEDKKP